MSNLVAYWYLTPVSLSGYLKTIDEEEEDDDDEEEEAEEDKGKEEEDLMTANQTIYGDLRCNILYKSIFVLLLSSRKAFHNIIAVNNTEFQLTNWTQLTLC